MERGIIAVVKICGAVHRSTAKEENIVALDEEIGILEADGLCVCLVAEIDEILDKLPIFTILRSHERKQTAVADLTAIGDAADDGIIISAHVVLADHKF